jgi:isochorismate synthase EntC
VLETFGFIIVTTSSAMVSQSEAILVAGKGIVHLSRPQHSAQISQCCLNTLFEGVF